MDFCRSVEVSCSAGLVSESRLVWASSSISTQRQGRTGRTCNGKVFRMVPKAVFKSFSEWETPAILLDSLVDPCLLLACSEHPSMQDPAALLEECLDAPEPAKIKSACDTLTALKLLDTNGRPTPSGVLLCELPVSVTHGMLVLEAGRQGVLFEGVLLASVRSNTPQPIARHFARDSEHAALLERFGGQREGSANKLLCQAAAYMFYYTNWMVPKRLDRILRTPSTEAQQSVSSEEERAFCENQGLSHTGLTSVEQTVFVIFEALHRINPHFLASNSHQAISSILERSGGQQQSDKYQDIWGEVTITKLRALLGARGYVGLQQQPTCSFFQRGHCSKGSKCSFRHAKEVCRFFDASGGCRWGSECNFSHSRDSGHNLQQTKYVSPFMGTAPVLKSIAQLRTDWSLQRTQGHLVLLGEGSLSYAYGLRQIASSSTLRITATTFDDSSKMCQNFGPISLGRAKQLRQSGVKVVHGVDATLLHLREDAGLLFAQCTAIQWNFPFSGDCEDCETDQQLIADLFESLAKCMLLGTLSPKVEVRLFLQADQFSRWRCLRAAAHSLFYVSAWHDSVPLSDIPDYNPSRNTSPDSFPFQRPVLYTFRANSALVQMHCTDEPSGSLLATGSSVERHAHSSAQLHGNGVLAKSHERLMTRVNQSFSPQRNDSSQTHGRKRRQPEAGETSSPAKKSKTRARIKKTSARGRW